MNIENLIEYIPNKIPHNFIDLTGFENENFKIISRTINSKDGRTQWNCQCKKCQKYCIKSNAGIKRDKSCGCLRNKLISKARIKDIRGQRFGMLTVIEDTGKRNKSENVIWKCKCDCGNITEVDSNNLNKLHTTSCGCIKESIGVTNISKILKENCINYVTEYKFKDLYNEQTNRKFRFDFAILDKEEKVIRLIEYDGIQHYLDTWGVWSTTISLAEQQQRDKIKNEYALSHNIPLVRIPYWERDNITLEMIMGPTYEVREAGQPTG